MTSAAPESDMLLAQVWQLLSTSTSLVPLRHQYLYVITTTGAVPTPSVTVHVNLTHISFWETLTISYPNPFLVHMA